VRTDHAHVLVASNSSRLLYGTLQAVTHERKRRAFVHPLWWRLVGENKDRDVQGVPATPSMGEVKCPAAGYQRPCRCADLAKELGGLRRDLEHHVCVRQPVFGVAAEVPSQEPLAALTHGCCRSVVRPCNKPIQRCCMTCADLPHSFV